MERRAGGHHYYTQTLFPNEETGRDSTHQACPEALSWPVLDPGSEPALCPQPLFMAVEVVFSQPQAVRVRVLERGPGLRELSL